MFDLNEVPSAEPRQIPLHKIDHTNGSKLDTVSVSVSPAVSPRKQQRRSLTHDHHPCVGNDDEDMANSSSDHICDDRNSYNKSLQSARCNSHVDVEDDDQKTAMNLLNPPKRTSNLTNSEAVSSSSPSEDVQIVKNENRPSATSYTDGRTDVDYKETVSGSAKNPLKRSASLQISEPVSSSSPPPDRNRVVNLLTNLRSKSLQDRYNEEEDHETAMDLFNPPKRASVLKANARSGDVSEPVSDFHEETVKTDRYLYTDRESKPLRICSTGEQETVSTDLDLLLLLPPQKRSSSLKYHNEADHSYEATVSDPDKNMVKMNDDQIPANLYSDRRFKSTHALYNEQESALDLLLADQKRSPSNLNPQVDRSEPAVSSCPSPSLPIETVRNDGTLASTSYSERHSKAVKVQPNDQDARLELLILDQKRSSPSQMSSHSDRQRKSQQANRDDHDQETAMELVISDRPPPKRTFSFPLTLDQTDRSLSKLQKKKSESNLHDPRHSFVERTQYNADPLGICTKKYSSKGTDILGNKPGISYNFIGDHHGSTSQMKNDGLIDESTIIDEDRSNNKSFAFDKGTSIELGSMFKKDVSSFGLSLGSGQNGSSVSLRPNDNLKVNQSSKDIDMFDLALGRSRRTNSKKGTDLISPFWCGKLNTPGVNTIQIPIDAFCPGTILRHDSKLKKLPISLNTQKFVKLDELQSNLMVNGIAEPLIQFRTSLDASNEEINCFNAMIEGRLNQNKSSSVPALDNGSRTPYAALISWRDDTSYNLDAKLYLISAEFLHIMLKNYRSDMLRSIVEELEVLDTESLYGIFCCSSSNSKINNKIDTSRSFDQNAGANVSISTNGKSETSLSHKFEKGKGISAHRTSPSRNTNHSSRVDSLTKSTSMGPHHASSRETNHRNTNFDDGDRGSRKRYQKQLSSTDMVHEGGGKYHNSKYDNGTSNSYEEDINYHSKHRDRCNWNGRRSERHEWRSGDRLKDTTRTGKEDKYLSKTRVKEHHRHSLPEGERGQKPKANEGDRNQEKGWQKEKERHFKDTLSEEMKTISDRNLVGSRSNSSFFQRTSPDCESGKSNKKRDREDEKEKVAHMKRFRESESEQVKTRENGPQLNGEEMNAGRPSKRESELIGKIVTTDVSMISQCLNEVNPLSNDLRSGDMLKLKDTEYHGIEIVKPSLDDILLQEKGDTNNQASLYCEADRVDCCITEVDVNFNVEKIPEERNEMVEDTVPSKWGEILHESSFVKVEEEFLVDVFDKEIRTWLLSKQNALYLQEEYGVVTVISSESSNSNCGSKTDSQNNSLQVRISMETAESCDISEAKWFVEQAAWMIKSISTRGVFIKCLWYEGPVQIHSGDGAPSVPSIVKKIKGDDGKNLEKIQDVTGVMIGVVLRKNSISTSSEVEPMSSQPRFIGLRLKCVRRKGLVEASKEVEALLESVADYFSKELATYISTHIADLQESGLHHGESLSNHDPISTHAILNTKALPNSPLKSGEQIVQESSDSPKLDGSHEGDVGKTIHVFKEESNRNFPIETKERASKQLCVIHVPEHITPIKIQNIFESVLKEKLKATTDFDNTLEIVANVRYIPDKFCAYVEFANDELLDASMKLYAEDKNVFHGLRVEVDQQSFSSRDGARDRSNNSVEYSREPLLSRSKSDNYGRRQDLDDDSDSDYFHNLWYGDNLASKTDHFLDKPRPLFLSELMRNASAQTIKQLFEDIITTYIGPSLVSSSGKQLVLDVRYVPSRGCAFVDLATPELVEFMLDLHSRRPEVFLNMKMELGRRPVPYSVEDEADRRLIMRNQDANHGKSQYGSQPYVYRLTSATGSRKNIEKRPSGSYNDYLEDSDNADDFLRQGTRVKKLRSDPEKTIYADRLPESATEGKIKKIFERVLVHNMSREELGVFGDELITEVRHVPSKYCAFVVFATEELTRIVLHLYNQDEDAFESMRLKPHFHSRLEDLYKEDLQDVDEIVHHPSSSLKERMSTSIDIDDFSSRARQSDIYDSRSTTTSNSRSAVHRAITASAFKEVDRRRSVYVDRIPEDLSEYTMTVMFEKAFRHRKHGHDGHMVSQVAYFRDKFDSTKLCAFVEVKTEDGTQDLVDFYNANPDAFDGVRVRPGFKYNT